MWRALAVGGVLAVAPGAGAQPALSAQTLLENARRLAERGHCPEALQLRPPIARLDPELARTGFDGDPFIAACIAGVMPPPEPAAEGSAAGDRTDEGRIGEGSAGDASARAPGPATCIPVVPYVEGTLLVAGGSPGFAELQRLALGIEAVTCEPTGGAGVSMRVGAAASARFGRLGFGGLSGNDALYASGGVELEVDAPVGESRLGVRLGGEVDKGAMVTAGVRWRRGDASLAADAFYTRRRFADTPPHTSQDAGVMLGGSYQLHPRVTSVGGALLAGAVISLAAFAVYASGVHD